jgi:hypothetical protein
MIKLELEINEVNTVLACLGKQPFDEVAALIVKIKQQGDPQADTIANAEATTDSTASASVVAE